jgi:hypothetical protein
MCSETEEFVKNTAGKTKGIKRENMKKSGNVPLQQKVLLEFEQLSFSQ